MSIRILVGLAGLPSVALGMMLVNVVVTEGLSGIGAFEVVYSLAGLVAVYIGVTGRRLF